MTRDLCINCGEPFHFHLLSADGITRACPPTKTVFEDGAPTLVNLPRGHFRRGVIEFLLGSGG